MWMWWPLSQASSNSLPPSSIFGLCQTPSVTYSRSAAAPTTRRGDENNTNVARPRCVCQEPQKFLKGSPHTRTLKHVLMENFKPTNRGSAIAGHKLCTILWMIEASVCEGHLLYLSGDCFALGCWKPDRAAAMSPCKDVTNMWMTEIEVPSGTNLTYNYFIKGEDPRCSDIIWKPGPQFSLSVPQKCNGLPGKVMVKDSWMDTSNNEFPELMWGSWLEVYEPIEFPVEFQYSFSSKGGENIVEEFKSNFQDWQSRSDYISNSQESYDKDYKGKMDIFHPKEALERDSFGSDQFVEEPWFTTVSSAMHNEPFFDNNSSDTDSRQNDFYPINVVRNTDKVVEEENKSVQLQAVSTIILINSSICTMQRVAILEDGELVEILLEPVKNNVQCGSVYLGVITKLVPHMGGAFVDIGTSRPSLLETKPTREPYIYPPFHCTVKCTYNNNYSGNKMEDTVIEAGVTSENHHDASGIHDYAAAHDFLGTEIQNGSVLHDDLVDQEEEDDEDDEDDADDDLDASDYLRWEKGAGHDGLESEPCKMAESEKLWNDSLMEEGPASECPIVESHISSESTLPNDSMTSMEANSLNGVANKWRNVRKGTKVVVQVAKEELGTKGPALTAYPNLRSRFWVLSTRCNRIGVSKKVSGVERTRLKLIAKTLQPPGFGLTVRTVAVGHSLEELQKDLEGLLSTWKDIVEHAKLAALASDEGVGGAVPVILHRAMGQTLSVVQDYFSEKVERLVVDSHRTYHEVTSYLQEIAPDLCNRVELYDKKIPIFDEYGIEEEINNILSKRIPLLNGGSLVIEQTEALVSIDVNGGHGMLGHGTSQQQAILDVNLVAARQIARELRLRDIGGIIVVDFIDMLDDANKRLVYEEIKKAVERDRSLIKISELSRYGLMEITRKRVRPSVTFMISEPCNCCHGTGRVEALETSFTKIEREICRLLATVDVKPNPGNAKWWPKFVLKVDRYMCNYLTSGKKTRLAALCSSLKVWILPKVTRGFSRGEFELKPFADEKANNIRQAATLSRLRSTASGSYISNTKLTLIPVKKLKGQRR